MKIWIYGAGAVGSYYGGRLKEAGQRVLFIARGQQLRALQERGLRAKSFRGNFEMPSVEACSDEDLESQFEPDFVIVCVKTYSNAEAAKRLKKVLPSGIPVFIFQNGVKSEEIFKENLAAQEIIRAVVYIAASLSSPGEIFHPSGEVITLQNHRFSSILLEAFEGSGVPIKISENIQKDIWSKVVWNAPFNSVTALTRLTTQPILSDEDGLKLIREIGNEVLILSKANNIQLPENIVEEKIKATIEGLGDITTSTLEDVKKGKPLEYTAVVGDLIDEANRLQILVPHLETVFTLLKLMNKFLSGKTEPN